MSAFSTGEAVNDATEPKNGGVVNDATEPNNATRAAGRHSDPLPPDLREALVDILADALVASYLRDKAAASVAILRYSIPQP